jgi:fumarate hydratase class II
MGVFNGQKKGNGRLLGIDSVPAAQRSMSAKRGERDSVGAIDVPAAGRLWGAQTQRSLQHFDICAERMPEEIVRGRARRRTCAAPLARRE